MNNEYLADRKQTSADDQNPVPETDSVLDNGKNKKKKRIRVLLRIAGAILLGVLLYHAVWLGWRTWKYRPYTDGMEKTVFATILTPRYTKKDEDGFDFSVKYPDYLQWTGNLSVGSPADENTMFTDALIIWPLFGGGYEYGLLLYEGDAGYQIYADENGHALNAEEDAVIARHAENVSLLYEKAALVFSVP